jgi:DNA adenine methylase
MVTNFYQVVQQNFPQLQKEIQATPFSRELYEHALYIYYRPTYFTKVEKAWAFWVACNQGWGGKVGTWGYGTADNKREISIARKRDDFALLLAERIGKTQIENYDALKIIKLRDREETFFYADPPYIDSAQGHYGGYTHQDFENLLEALTQIKGKFLLSSYPSEILDKFTQKHGWQQIKIEQKTMASKTRKPKIEVLTANYDIKKGGEPS